jgi:hypothetical protein
MTNKGIFGYIIGKKKRMMRVENDAELLWQLLVREIYILIKHYGSKELLQEAFAKIKIIKNPKKSDIEKCKIFTDMEEDNVNNILRYCQGSFINILEAGFILNETEESNHVFILDFNKGSVRFYYKDWQGNIKDIDGATIEEIMEFDEMPSKSYTEIVTEMRDRFNNYYEKYLKINKEIDKLNQLKIKAKQEGAANIEEKVNKLFDDLKWELKELNMGQRVFYHRLKALDLIDESNI